MEHNESIFRDEWKDDWKLVKNENRSSKAGRGADLSVIGRPLRISGAAVFALIGDLLNIHPLGCMYILHLINDALRSLSKLVELPGV